MANQYQLKTGYSRALYTFSAIVVLPEIYDYPHPGGPMSRWGQEMKRRVGAWLRPWQCASFWAWIHQTWLFQKHWDGPDCLVVVWRSRWFGFEFEEEKYIED